MTAMPGVHLVEHCDGREWAASPALRSVYVLADPDPAVVGRRVCEALTALTEPRPWLRVLAGGATG